jgi:L-threonylcarbamoyladenylate synthase
VLPKTPAISSEATAGRETVGVRVPDHQLALEMLRAFGGPVAAPSANRTTRVSPTSAEHVMAEVGDKIDLVLDGGQCPVGIESTVLDLTTFPRPTLLRPGSISVAQIEPLIGPVDVYSHKIVNSSQSAPSPGLSALHYAPQTPAYRFGREEYLRAMTRLTESSAGVALVALLSRANIPGPHDVVPMPHAPDAYARVMYSTLRSADAGGYAGIYIELPPDTPEWLAVRDRLTRATRPLAG